MLSSMPRPQLTTGSSGSDAISAHVIFSIFSCADAGGVGLILMGVGMGVGLTRNIDGHGAGFVCCHDFALQGK
jgi:hypothetical protein